MASCSPSLRRSSERIPGAAYLRGVHPRFEPLPPPGPASLLAPAFRPSARDLGAFLLSLLPRAGPVWSLTAAREGFRGLRSPADPPRTGSRRALLRSGGSQTTRARSRQSKTTLERKRLNVLYN